MSKPSDELLRRAREWSLQPENHPVLQTAQRTPSEQEITERMGRIQSGEAIVHTTVRGFQAMLAEFAEQIVRDCANLMNDDLEDLFPDLWRRYSRNEITLRQMESAAILSKFGLKE